MGEYGLRNKREVYRVQFTLAKIRHAARELLTMDEKVTQLTKKKQKKNKVLIFFFSFLFVGSEAAL